MHGMLFPSDLPEKQWTEFEAAGFSEPVSGIIFQGKHPPCCGVPLGGISTGCIDIDARGVFGFSHVFNPVSNMTYGGKWRIARKLPKAQPILGIAIGKKTWVLATGEIINGGDIHWCTEPCFTGSGVQIEGIKPETDNQDRVHLTKIEGVRPAGEIHYWGHYPVADLQYETDAPVQIAMRAWSPFIPGDTEASNIPAAVFEVSLHNTLKRPQKCTLAFNFPGPDEQEARSSECFRDVVDEDVKGVMVQSTGGVSYVLGIIGDRMPRCGSGLNKAGAWSEIGQGLPQPACRRDEGHRLYQDASSSLAMDMSLKAGETKTIRFLLAWYAPVWEGAKEETIHRVFRGTAEWRGGKWSSRTHFFTHMYAARYGDALDVARRVAIEHTSLLERVLAWQNVIYRERAIPVWLRDSLVNNLALIAEDSYWAQAKEPLGAWAYPEGVFGLNESPRGCPHITCIPCDWYGNLPIVYFFPDLALSTLRILKEYQFESGEVPFSIGSFCRDLPDFASPRYGWQVSLNGTCYVDMVHRLWRRTGDDNILKEFYDSLKCCNTFTMDLCKGPGGVISMPESGGMEWFEFGEWLGMCSHMGGMRLAQLRMMADMAQHMGDTGYVKRCEEWYADGSRAMEEALWNGSYYLNFYDRKTGKKSDAVMGYQLDGQWAVDFHGLPEVFLPERVKKTLATIKDHNVALTPEVGAANFTLPDGSPLASETKVAFYGAYSMFPAELLVLAMTYIYNGEKDFGIDLARRHWDTLVRKQLHPWDMPNIVNGKTGARIFGTDYYQAMMLWAMPAAIHGLDIALESREGRFVDSIIQAGKTDDR